MYDLILLPIWLKNGDQTFVETHLNCDLHCATVLRVINVDIVVGTYEEQWMHHGSNPNPRTVEPDHNHKADINANPIYPTNPIQP